MAKKSLWSLSKGSDNAELAADVSEHDGYELISVRGRLTIDSSPRLLDEFRRVFKENPVLTQLKVDLRQVRYIDSSGISVLIQGFKMAQRRSVEYVLLDPSPKVRSVIELSQLHEFFTIESSTGGE